MDSQTAPSTKEKQDEDPFQSGGLKQPLVFSASNFVVKRGRGERGGDRWEGTHMKRRRNFSQNLPLRQFEARLVRPPVLVPVVGRERVSQRLGLRGDTCTARTAGGERRGRARYTWLPTP